MKAGTYNLEDLKRGDTFYATPFRIFINGVEANITSARAHFRTSDDTLVHASVCTVSGGLVTIPEMADTVTELFPAETLYYDLEVTLTTGAVKTFFGGTMTVSADITHD
jgi:hypothetical protein